MAPNLEKGHVFKKKKLPQRPSDSKAVMGAMRASGVDYPERLGRPVCQYYMKTGMCKIGASCKYHHPSQGCGSSMPTTLNIYGYPLRSGEKECSYYVKTGQCKFGVTCKFHHPQPAVVQVAAPRDTLKIRHTYTSSGSSPVSDYFADLPQEVLLDILIRLPIKSMGRSRCVSKPWLSLLTSYEFIKAHLAHHTHIGQEQKLLLCSSSLFSLTLHLGGNHLRELEFFDKKMYGLVGSCNGLVLVTDKRTDKWLINCMTKEYVKLPESPFPLCPHFSFKKYGFGYDERSDDYKIVKISQCDYGQFGNSQPNCSDIFVDIYSSKMRSWKRLGTSLYGHDLINHDSCVFINGAVHWVGLKFKFSSKQAAVICAFDLSDEKFTEFPAPASVSDGLNYLRAQPMVIDGCLGIVVRPWRFGAAEGGEIWFTKSCSLVESWTKLVIDFKPLCVHQDKILFQDDRRNALKWYCLKDARVEACLAEDGTYDSDDDERYFSEGITYSESLVSPHFNYRD